MSEPTIAYIALGSNLGDRRAAIFAALRELEAHDDITVLRCSAIIETDPVGVPGQGRYLNAAAELETTLAPPTLLDEMLRIEREHGRDREREQRHGPRSLDLDLLLYGDRVIDQPGLHVPHPRMVDREFVLGPLCELGPNLIHPQLGVSLQGLLDRLRVKANRSNADQAAMVLRHTSPGKNGLD